MFEKNSASVSARRVSDISGYRSSSVALLVYC